MKPINKPLLTLVFLFTYLICSAQNEFKLYDNGLIYSDSTMSQLGHIVDSLNLKYLQCDEYKVFNAQKQAKVSYYKFEKNLDEVHQMMLEGMLPEEILNKYKAETSDSNLLMVRDEHKTWSGSMRAIYYTYPKSHKMYCDDTSDCYNYPADGNVWIIDRYKGSEYVKANIEAYYLQTPFQEKVLPEKYNKLVQYVDCMIDTTSQVMHEDAVSLSWFNPKEGEKYKYLKVIDSLLKECHHRTDSMFNLYPEKKQYFIENLEKACDMAIDSGAIDPDLEYYASKYLSDNIALELKRRRRVVGSCSMDNSPRYHAVEIAVLSASAVRWDVFLRAHLNIMNDFFSRVSDGSYAWAARETYLKELEELGINVHDLLLGTVLRVENNSNNHYFSSIGRVGRALSESNNKLDIEARMTSMIADSELDDYNRLLIYYMFTHYVYNLPKDSKDQKRAEEKMKESRTLLPEYIAIHLK